METERAVVAETSYNILYNGIVRIPDDVMKTHNN